MINSILVVDDDAAYGRMLQLLLRSETIDVSVHTNADDAVFVITGARPSLVVLDLNIGQQGAGLSILAALRGQPETRELPVILCSGDDRLSSLPVDRFTEKLAKPYEPDELIARVQKSLSHAESHPSTEV